MTRALNLVGQVFGRWKVIRIDQKDKHRNIMWLCLCECGVEKSICGSSLKSGFTTSCGCYQKEQVYNKLLTHGQTIGKSETVEYRTWASMKDRCNNASSTSWRNYGGRGIKVCEKWLNFDLFFNDMGVKPSKNHSIDRIDVDGDYEPLNCVWSTREEQERNKRVKSNSKSGISGVTWDAERSKWIVRIKTNKVQITIGRYLNLGDAIQSRKEAELKYWGKSS